MEEFRFRHIHRPVPLLPQLERVINVVIVQREIFAVAADLPKHFSARHRACPRHRYVVARHYRRQEVPDLIRRMVIIRMSRIPVQKHNTGMLNAAIRKQQLRADRAHLPAAANTAASVQSSPG